MNIQAIASVLESTLNHDKNTRKQAEETLKQMRSQSQFPQLLLHLITSEGISDATKTAAAVYFKNLARNHWDPREDSRISDSDKQEVRNVVISCLIVSKPNLRTILSDAIAHICDFDFPQQWPNVVNELVAKFTQNPDLNVISGALYTAHSIFKRYRLEMELKTSTQQQLLGIIQIFGAPMLELLEKTASSLPANVSNKPTLEQLYVVLNLLTEIFFDLNCLDIADWFLNNLSRFMAVFLTLISFTSPVLIDASETEQPGPLEENKALVLQCITLCLEKFDEDFKPFVEKFTVAVWELLLALSQNPKHDRLCVSGMAFLTGVSKTIYHTLLADPAKQTMICEKIIIPNMELRESDMEMFQDDPHEYIQRDIEGSDSDTRRRSACDLIQGLSKNYEQTVTDIFQRYVGFLTQTYTSNLDNWKAKDTAMYLITALTVRGATTQQGTRRINDLVNIGDFFQNHVLPELQDPDPTKVKYPIIKADAIKFVSSFRLQIPKDRYPLLLQLLAQWLRNSNEVVHSYAASAIERLLMVKEPDNQLRLHKDQWKEFVGPLLQHLFQSIQSSQQENEYLMKAVMRVILCGQEHIAPFVPHILPMLTNILTQVARNPKQPTFNHYLFESISGIVRYSPAHLVAVNQALFPLFTQILQSDTPEFMPYVFQILSQILEGGLEVSQPYIQLFPPLLSPTLYENKGNIPPLVRLIRTFLQRAPAQVIAAGQLNAVMGVFQYLVSSKLYDHEGFNLLNTIVGYVPKDSLAGTLKTVFSVLFTRLMNSRTTKYVKCLLVYLSLFAIKISPDTLVEAVESLQPQPGLYKQVYLNVWLRDVQKVSGKIPRKMCVTALSKICSESQYTLSDAVFGELWLPTVVAALKLMELGEEADAEGDKYVSKNEVTVDQLKQQQQDQGYMNSYCPLQAASKTDEDPCAEISDERAYFAQSLQKVVASHGNKCIPALRSLPADIQQRLKPVLPNVF